MVNNLINISRFKGEVPDRLEADTSDRARRVDDGPLYSADEIIAVIRSDGEKPKARHSTRKSARDAAEAGLEIRDICSLIEESLSNGRYRNSEWCCGKNQKHWAACDVYTIRKKEPCERMQSGFADIEYYLKFALREDGELILLFSTHLS